MKASLLIAIPRTTAPVARRLGLIKGSAIADPELIDLGRVVAEALPLRGRAYVEYFCDRELGLRVTDINARFGGAFACPMYAALPGPNHPELIVGCRAGSGSSRTWASSSPGRHVHALLLAPRARRGAAADRGGTSLRRAAPPALMRPLLIDDRSGADRRATWW